MSLFTAGDKLKVIVLGNDGIMRSAFVERTASMAGNKYIITQEDVFLIRVKKWDLFWVDQPAIMFRENSIHAIPKVERDSFPTPQETADTIENAAMHLYTLFGKQSNIMMILLLILAGVAAGGACVGAYYGYQHDSMLKAIHSDIASITAATVSGTGDSPQITLTPTPTVKPSPKPTVAATVKPPSTPKV